jgi:hypothetical protein
MIPKSGYRFSDKITRKTIKYAAGRHVGKFDADVTAGPLKRKLEPVS